MPSHKVIELITRYEELVANLSHLLLTKSKGFESRRTALRVHLNSQRTELIQEIEELRADLELTHIF